MQEIMGIEITNENDLKLATAICPDLMKGYDLDQVKGSFFMIGLPTLGAFALVPRDGIEKFWEGMRMGPAISLRTVVRERPPVSA